MALSVTVHGITFKTGAQTSGRLATADLATQNGLDNVVYTVSTSPDMDYAIVAVSVCNRAQTAAESVAIAVCDSDVPKDQDFVEWNTTLVPNGVLERTQIIMQRGQRLIVRWGASRPQLVPDNEINDYGTNWTGAVSGTTTVDATTPGEVTFTCASDLDNWSLTSSPYPLLETGETYQVGFSVSSTDVVGADPTFVFETWPTATELVALSLPQMNLNDEYHTYTADLIAGIDIPIAPSLLRIRATEVTATIDRIIVKKIS
jgi:hypothetical protein